MERDQSASSSCSGDVHVFDFGADRCQCGAKAQTEYPAPPGDSSGNGKHTTDGPGGHPYDRKDEG